MPIIEATGEVLSHLNLTSLGEGRMLQSVVAKRLERGDLELENLLCLRELLRLSGYEGEDHAALHLLLLMLFTSLAEGSLCIKIEKDILTSYLLGDEEAPLVKWISQIEEGLNHDHWNNLITTDPSQFLPLIYLPEKKLLYFQTMYVSEQKVRELLFSRLGLIETNIDELVDAYQPIRENQRLAMGQKTALALALLNKTTLISGGPGTGKTTLIVELLLAYQRLGLEAGRVRVAAPTGRAAQRIREAMDGRMKEVNHCAEREFLSAVQTSTLHRLLQYSPGRGRFNYHAYNQLPINVLVVDEVSMVDMEMMANLLEALTKETQLILVGDRDQLPSVEAGAIFGDLVPHGMEPRYGANIKQMLNILLPESNLSNEEQSHTLMDCIAILDKSFRSVQEINQVAHAVNSGKAEEVINLVQTHTTTIQESLGAIPHQTGFGWIPSTQQPLERVLEDWMKYQLDQPVGNNDCYQTLVSSPISQKELESEQSIGRLNQIFTWINRARILTVVRRKGTGCETINRQLVKKLRPVLDPENRRAAYAGIPILVTSNDYSLGLFNGDIGVVLKVKMDDETLSERVFFKREESGYRCYLLDEIPGWEYAFAITVHKSQGSEVEEALLVLPDDPDHRLLTREIVYTGLTRARKLVLVYASEQSLRRGVERKINRFSGLREELRD